MKLSTVDRFNRHVNKSGNCWIWTGSKNTSKGEYGRFYFGDKRMLAHRVSYELFCGQIPEGNQVLHRCDNPSCVNPDHLFLGTTTDNMQDMMAKGRGKCARGIDHHRAKLNPEKAFEIRWRAALGHKHGDIASDFGVTRPLISAICRNEIWRQECHD